MPFQRGRSGNPKGRPTADKPWREALRKAANEIDSKTKKRRLYLIATAVATAAQAGDMQAAKEIGDRLDGRAAPSPEETQATKDLIVQLVKYRA